MVLFLLVGNDIRDQDLGTRVLTVPGVSWVLGPLVDRVKYVQVHACLLYTSDAADDWLVV